VGGWLGAGSFWAVGYAGYLFPLLLALYGVTAFVRPGIAARWPALAGLALLVASATGMLARASDTLTAYRIHKGGVIGWGVSEGLRLSVGTVGTWIILLALVPVGILFVTQISYGLLSHALGAWLARLRRQNDFWSLRADNLHAVHMIPRSLVQFEPMKSCPMPPFPLPTAAAKPQPLDLYLRDRFPLAAESPGRRRWREKSYQASPGRYRWRSGMERRTDIDVHCDRLMIGTLIPNY